MSIKTNGNLLPASPNVPLDARSRVATEAEILQIQNPYLGGIVYCVATGKHYKITGLKPKTVGPLTVQNAAVDTYEEFASAQDQDAPVDGQQYARQNGGWAVIEHPKPPKPEEDAPTDGQQYARQNGGWAVIEHPEPVAPEPGGGTPLTVWQLTKPADGVHLLVKRAGADGTRANAVTIIDTSSNEADRAKVSAYMDAGADGFWVTCQPDGFPSPYDDAPVAVDLSGVEQPAILYYCWLNDEGIAGDWHSQRFPVVGGAGAAGKDGKNGDNAPVLISQYSADGVSNWHSAYADDMYMRTSADNGLTWSVAIRLQGPQGEQGEQGKQGEQGNPYYIACLSPTAPASVYDGMIWIKGGDALSWIHSSQTPAIVVNEVVDPSTAADYTIVITE